MIGHAPTPAEDALARALTKRGLRFKREAKLGGGYEADFYFPEAKLTVEVDGHQHRDIRWKIRSDLAKCNALASMGVATLRFSNETVLASPGAVASRIATIIAARKLMNPQERPVCKLPRSSRGRNRI